MENKINIAELLRNCPKGMELDCTKYSNVYFLGIDDCKKEPKIKLKVETSGTWCSELTLDKYGKESSHPNAKCLIFPKGKITWEGFHRPFEDGDILTTITGSIFIYKKIDIYNYCGSYASLDTHNGFWSTYYSYLEDCCRLATEEEKTKLFDVIKENGYKWNAETKTLEKLPKFKVGDRVKHISAYVSGVVVKVSNKGYYIDYPKGEGVCYISFTSEKDYELASNEFDITTLVPFESRVLVRDTEEEKWKPAIWGYYDVDHIKGYPYETVGGNCFCLCIPYEHNEHLLSTTNDCDDFYKTWEE